MFVLVSVWRKVGLQSSRDVMALGDITLMSSSTGQVTQARMELHRESEKEVAVSC